MEVAIVPVPDLFFDRPSGTGQPCRFASPTMVDGLDGTTPCFVHGGFAERARASFLTNLDKLRGRTGLVVAEADNVIDVPRDLLLPRFTTGQGRGRETSLRGHLGADGGGGSGREGAMGGDGDAHDAVGAMNVGQGDLEVGVGVGVGGLQG